MACETMRKPKQTIEERVAEIGRAVAALESRIKLKTVKPVVDKKTGGIAFAGWENAAERADVTDACAYRRIMATGSALARAEQFWGEGKTPETAIAKAIENANDARSMIARAANLAYRESPMRTKR
jgi:hypothetical protein